MTLSRSARAWLFDAGIAVVFTTFALVVGRALAENNDERYDTWTIVTGLAIGAALALRRLAPELSLAGTVVGLAVWTAADFAGGPIYLAPLVPLYTIATAGDRRRTLIAAAGMTAGFLVIAPLSHDRGAHLGFLLAFAGWAGGAVFLGTAQYNRRAYLAELEQRARDLEESREEEARRRVAEERLRIARDLHDVIAHGIATIHMQSGAALHVLDRQPEQAAPALAAVKQLSKQTMQELRATLDVLRAGDADGDEAAPLAPTPGLDRLDALVAVSRRAGLPVELHVVGAETAVRAAVDVAAYRIVQESLTNVMRHAGERAHATVTVSHGDHAVDIDVVDDGLGAAAVSGTNGGHGITGMRERAATVGGTVTAGANPGGGFRVRAHLPFDGEQ
jgi:signal transduction histidine kinase